MKRMNLPWVPIIVWALMLVVWISPPVTRIFHAVVKPEEMRWPYSMIFFLLLLVVIVLLSRVVNRLSVLWVVAIGAAAGYVAAIAAATFAGVFAEGGYDHLVTSFSRFGFWTVMDTNAWVAFVLGGWFFGLIAALFVALSGRARSP